ncbi:hypothetical protein M501DRAFT_998683 [Patellaria atrata CBS 101060]|uniref:TPR domain-containing protein n=1 Tax=Patellaria atrata CBS 101060 TaxID=1346257 RepID=A0A9P4VUD7_9PEZI|nr:hypothetical protein M501DRAFT_998683 [Patellaria atrata CBS 101060]
MAKTRPKSKSKSKSKNKHKIEPDRPEDAPSLLTRATSLLQTSQPAEALPLAQRALSLLQPTSAPTPAALPALTLLGEINVELGDIDAARGHFSAAAEMDPDGGLGGADKFLWLAQLCEEGGREAVGWFERGAGALRREIGVLEGNSRKGKRADGVLEEGLETKKRKLADALCGVVEVYMTDLSWEEDAETRCETLVTEALLVAPNNPEPLQTLASVRISQEKAEDARIALTRSMELWKDLDPEDPAVPAFPTRISLARLLMEVEMEEDAIEVLERLVAEDDSSVESWYLGGWCLHLLADKRKGNVNGSGPSDLEGKDTATKSILHASREWTQNCLKLYQVLEYEDERLREHALELLEDLNRTLGPETEDDEGWEDEEDGSEDEDEEMKGT